MEKLEASLPVLLIKYRAFHNVLGD